MSLATTTTRLELLWRRQTRRHSPTRRWAATHPVLAGDVDEIRDRLDDGDRDRSGPTLAALVQLAVDGDTDAALLVTLALLPRMVAAEKARGRYDYDALAGHLWEAVVTTSNPHARCLRETIERNTWRRHWRDGRQDTKADLIDFGRGDICTVRTRSKPVTTTSPVEHDVLSAQQVAAALDRLTDSGTISDPTRRLLEHLAAGTATTRPGERPETARKERWRATRRLHDVPGLYEVLSA